MNAGECFRPLYRWGSGKCSSNGRSDSLLETWHKGSSCYLFLLMTDYQLLYMNEWRSKASGDCTQMCTSVAEYYALTWEVSQLLVYTDKYVPLLYSNIVYTCLSKHASVQSISARYLDYSSTFFKGSSSLKHVLASDWWGIKSCSSAL